MPKEAGLWRFIPALIGAVATLWFAQFLPVVSTGEIPEYVAEWVPQLGISLAFRLDGLALAFALLISGIGALVFLYAATYFRSDRRLASLLVTLLAFAISMLGLTCADDAITLFIFWEGTTVTSFLLIGFDHEKQNSRWAAIQALVITGAGGLALLAGLLIMGGMAGTLRLSEMNQMGDMFRASELYPLVFALVMLGCFTKSAQWPFHFWLPGAMAAPTPVSAYLHSATMVKAGVFLMARFTPALGGTDLWTWTLVPVGAFTMILTSVWAMRQTDLKLMLAFTTVMGLSMITMLLGLSTPESIAAAMTFLLIHAFYKAGLFLSVGMIEKGSGSRNYPELGGLARSMPLTVSVVALAALSMAGMIPFFGFIGKEMIYEATLHTEFLTYAVSGAALLANALMVACAMMIAIRPFFFSHLKAPKETPADPGWGLYTGPCVLAALGLLFGVLPGPAEYGLVGPMVEAVSQEPLHAHLALWHGVKPPLYLSIATFILGFLLYVLLDRIARFLSDIEDDVPRTESWYDGLIHGLGRFSHFCTYKIQNGHMTSYLRRTYLALGIALWLALFSGAMSWPELRLSIEFIDWAIFAIIIGSIVVVIRTNSRLTAIAALGGIGSSIAVIFVVYGAPDVAMTQLFVEILVVVFMAIAMVKLPRSGNIPFRPLDATISVVLGVGVTTTMLMVLGTDIDLKLTKFFEEKSVPDALGHNIVNVILVDFRGLDTMGETAVIAIAAIAAYAVLKAGRSGNGRSS
ncbi:hydrogen gas-evolving membrane-bound hydrogenase subunit E [Amaricoccus macauensis]|uniref:hydrogen gas-evolving membrane-bound hydrogenase subunit E n=1 Tax=Amaricoccus macauensis TaxID=57001 RepID=UPI003C7A26DA